MQRSERFDINEESKKLMVSIIDTHKSNIPNGSKSSKLASIGKSLTKEINYCFNADSTVSNKVAMVRGDIKKSGVFHHLFEKRIDELSDKYKWLNVSLKRIKNLNSEKAEFAIIGLTKEADNERNKYILRKDKETANTFLSIIEDLKLLKVYPEPYYHLVLTKAQRDSIKNNSSENRKERLENGQVTVPYEPCVDLCYELLNSDLHYELALGVGLATGRRFSEIYSTAEFTIISDYVLEFSGQIKKFTSEVKPYEIYTYVKPELILTALDKLRQNERVISVNKEVDVKGDFSPINSNFSGYANKIANKKLSILYKRKWSFSDTRALWSRIVFEEYYAKDPKWKNTSEDLFWTKMLGHDNPETQLDYKKFKISRGVKLKSTLDKLIESEEDVLGLAESSHITTNRILKLHDSLFEYVRDNPNAKINKSLLKRTKKAGGLGGAQDVVVEYWEIIEPFLK